MNVRFTFNSTGTSTSAFDGGNYVVVMTGPPRPTALPDAFVDAIWNAAAWLEIDLPTSRAIIEKARRTLARTYHPDAGGSLEAMQAINAAADYLLRFVS